MCTLGIIQKEHDAWTTQHNSLYLPYERMASDATCASVFPCASAIFCSSANAASFTITRGMRDTEVVGTTGTGVLFIATGAACTPNKKRNTTFLSHLFVP